MLPARIEGERLDQYALRLNIYIQTSPIIRSITSPTKGGCWYCWSKTPQLDSFSFEFDTYLHRVCVERWYEAHPQDPEVHIIARELGVANAR